MSDNPDLALVKILWYIKGGKVSILNNGREIISIARPNRDPEVTIDDLESLISLVPSPNINMLERTRQLSKELSKTGQNIAVKMKGRRMLNFGRDESFFRDFEGFANVFYQETRKRLRKL